MCSTVCMQVCTLNTFPCICFTASNGSHKTPNYHECMLHKNKLNLNNEIFYLKKKWGSCLIRGVQNLNKYGIKQDFRKSSLPICGPIPMDSITFIMSPANFPSRILRSSDQMRSPDILASPPALDLMALSVLSSWQSALSAMRPQNLLGTINKA